MKIMANQIEAAKNYVGSVLERITGVNAYGRWQRYVEKEAVGPITTSMRNNRKASGVLVGGVQIIFPAAFTLIADVASVPRPSTERVDLEALSFLAKDAAVSLIEFGLWSLVATSRNPVEFALYKLAANAVTHAGLDLAGVAVNRLRHFKPSATTLAV